MKLFIDANILVAVLNKEYPLFTYAAKILSLSDRKGFELYTSPVCIAIAFYFACKKTSESSAKKKIALLLEHIKITTVDHECTVRAVTDPKINDIEDGIQYHSAEKKGCNYIITENEDDFYFSKIKVLNCENFLKFELAAL
jgi:predicted nucleic acid-binding protein